MAIHRNIICIFIISLLLSINASTSRAEVRGLFTRTEADPDFGVRMLFGGEYGITDTLSISTDVAYWFNLESPPELMGGNGFQYDLGPQFTIFETFYLLPELGLFYSTTHREISGLLPQLYFYGNTGNWHIQLWSNFAIGLTDVTSRIKLYEFRLFFKYAFWDFLALGPHFEFMYYFNLDPAIEAIVESKVNKLLTGAVFGFTLGDHDFIDMLFAYDWRAKYMKRVDPTNRDLFARVTWIHLF